MIWRRFLIDDGDLSAFFGYGIPDPRLGSMQVGIRDGAVMQLRVRS